MGGSETLRGGRDLVTSSTPITQAQALLGNSETCHRLLPFLLGCVVGVDPTSRFLSSPGMALTVDVVGPAPWGFRISGGRDFHTPIIVTKVRAVFPS